MKIASSEQFMIGKWTVHDNEVSADEVCRRIESLIVEYLLHVATDPSGWESLYRDPEDHRLWELTYPQSEMHGGGPPALRQVAFEFATEKYGIKGSDG